MWQTLKRFGEGKIIRQAREESRNNARIRKALEGMEVEGDEDESIPLALVLLTYLLPDVRTTPDSNKC